MKTLNDSELLKAQKIINESLNGTYELKELYGDKWIKIKSPTSFGKIFKKTVESGFLKSIEVQKQKSNNHYTYKISKNKQK